MSRPCSAGSRAAPPHTRGIAPGWPASSTRPSTRSGPTPLRRRPSARTRAADTPAARRRRGLRVRHRPRRTEHRRRPARSGRADRARHPQPRIRPGVVDAAAAKAADGLSCAGHHRGPRRTGRTAARHRRDRDPRLARRREPRPLPRRRPDAPRCSHASARRAVATADPSPPPGQTAGCSTGSPTTSTNAGTGDAAPQPRAASRLPRRGRARTLDPSPTRRPTRASRTVTAARGADRAPGTRRAAGQDDRPDRAAGAAIRGALSRSRRDCRACRRAVKVGPSAPPAAAADAAPP